MDPNVLDHRREGSAPGLLLVQSFLCWTGRTTDLLSKEQCTGTYHVVSKALLVLVSYYCCVFFFASASSDSYQGQRLAEHHCSHSGISQPLLEGHCDFIVGWLKVPTLDVPAYPRCTLVAA